MYTHTRVRRPDANFRFSSSASQPCVFETGTLMGLKLVNGLAGQQTPGLICVCLLTAEVTCASPHAQVFM